MKIFHCDHCQQLVFFENVRCLACGHALAYVPELEELVALEPVGENLWRFAKRSGGERYRLCANYDGANVCNWAVAAADPESLCRSCRLTRVIPDLGQPGNTQAWYRLEVAKRRLVYSLLRLGLPVENKTAEPERGVVFELLAESDTPGAEPVLTGHNDGVITINVAEADDAEREQRRQRLHEPYRTLLGHFRHEIGHYYWQRILAEGGRLEAFRALFGDERTDYGEALQRHYDQGPGAQWQERFISAYASAHPWEDWAETWAHYLHMTDALETAAACGLSLRPRRADEPTLKTAGQDRPLGPFEQKIEAWFPLTYVLNNLNRGLGLPDGYPFVLTPLVIDKLRFVHETIAAAAGRADAPAAPPSQPREASAAPTA
jgi:hypothetical protein